MKSRIVLPLVVLGCLAVAATAYAAVVQQNTYTVTGAINGGKGASSKKPKPVSLKFNYTVGEVNNNRPSPVTKYSILFGGVRVNPTAIPGCDINKLNSPMNVKDTGVCPKKSIVGSGSIVNIVGQPSDISNKALYCYLKLTTVNSKKKGHFLLYLKGSPQASTDEKKNCIISVAEAIDAKLVKKPTGTALQFSVPDNLLHPAGLDNAVTNVQTSIKKATGKVNGKTVGYFAAVSCKKTQKIDVAFTQESDGSVGHASTIVPCTK